MNELTKKELFTLVVLHGVVSNYALYSALINSDVEAHTFAEELAEMTLRKINYWKEEDS